MLGYLKKFNNLPAELREKVSNQEAMAIIEGLEKKYQLPLAAFIMRVMVKEIALADLGLSLLKENLTETAAGQLAKELEEKIFFSLADYLSPPADQPGKPAQNLTPRPKAAPPSKPKPLVGATGPSVQPLIKGASFFFSPDDEQEIKELAKKIDLAEKTELSAARLEEKLEAITNRAQINFGSADLADRFKQILKTYLRGIRNKLEAELALTKPFASGGLSFDEDSAQKVMAMADKIVHPVKSQSEIGTRSVFNGVNSRPGSPNRQAGETIKLSAKIRIPELEKSQEERLAVARDAPYDFSKLAKEGKIFDSTEPRLEPDRSRVEEPNPELAPLTPARLAVAPARQAVTVAKPQSVAFPAQEKKPLPARAEDKVSISSGETGLPTRLARLDSRLARLAEDSAKRAEQAGNTSQMPLISLRFQAENLSRSQKVKIEDVKYVPRVMSPLDEIRYLDLINFRRLDKDPRRAIDKIKSKINLLEEEGYGKKLEAIKFWRSSPLNRLYLEIGHLSIGKNKPVDAIIEERKIKTSDYLTTAEFEAIMDLNKSLRF